MRRKQVWRYYCDFCRKANCSAGAIAAHERSCTANPGRVCRMCAAAEKEEILDKGTARPLAELIAMFDGTDAGLERLKTAARGCPACILAALRQHPRNTTDADGRPLALDWPHWDYRSAREEFLAEINDASNERHSR